MAEAWGVSRSGQPEGAARKPGPRVKVKVAPKVAHAAHRGIVWLHLSAIAVWLFIAALLGALAAAGKTIPPAVIAAGVAAAAGHGIFLLTHLYFAAAARKRLASQS
jgi:hypothetical protein